MKTFHIYVGRSGRWEIEATAFTVTESGHVVFWRDGEKYAVLGPSGYRLVVEYET